jgi:hypothetical protein
MEQSERVTNQCSAQDTEPSIQIVFRRIYGGPCDKNPLETAWGLGTCPSTTYEGSNGPK